MRYDTTFGIFIVSKQKANNILYQILFLLSVSQYVIRDLFLLLFEKDKNKIFFKSRFRKCAATYFDFKSISLV